MVPVVEGSWHVMGSCQWGAWALGRLAVVGLQILARSSDEPIIHKKSFKLPIDFCSCSSIFFPFNSIVTVSWFQTTCSKTTAPAQGIPPSCQNLQHVFHCQLFPFACWTAGVSYPKRWIPTRCFHLCQCEVQVGVVRWAGGTHGCGGVGYLFYGKISR